LLPGEMASNKEYFMPEDIHLSCISNKSAVPVMDQPQLVYVLSEISPGGFAPDVRLPLNFALVLDRSGSMAGEKIRTMREAVKNIIDQLDPMDVVSVITFESTTQVLIPAQAVGNKPLLKSMVDSIRDGGGTSMAPAIREAVNQVSTFHNSERISRIILLTDGEVTDKEADSFREADHAGALGIPLIGLGLGSDWNTDFVQELADRSLQAAPKSRVGYADYIATPDQAFSIFQQVFQSMQIVCKDVTVTMRMVQGVEARRVWQVTPMIKDISLKTIQGRSVVIAVGDLDKSGAAFMMELVLPPRPEGMMRAAQLDVTYTRLQKVSGRAAADLIVNFSADPALVSQIDSRVMGIVEKVTAFKLQTQALDEATAGNIPGATQRLRQAVTILLNQGETQLAQQMEKEAQNLEQGKGISEEGSKTIRLTSRKTVRLD